MTRSGPARRRKGGNLGQLVYPGGRRGALQEAQEVGLPRRAGLGEHGTTLAVW
jgi:hypothetical protein